MLLLVVDCSGNAKRDMDKINLSNEVSVACKVLSKEEYASLLEASSKEFIGRNLEKYNLMVRVCS